jgi:hypothetical protein
MVSRRAAGRWPGSAALIWKGDIVYQTGPRASGWRRFGVDVMSLLPIDRLL